MLQPSLHPLSLPGCPSSALSSYKSELLWSPRGLGWSSGKLLTSARLDLAEVLQHLKIASPVAPCQVGSTGGSGHRMKPWPCCPLAHFLCDLSQVPSLPSLGLSVLICIMTGLDEKLSRESFTGGACPYLAEPGDVLKVTDPCLCTWGQGSQPLYLGA